MIIQLKTIEYYFFDIDVCRSRSKNLNSNVLFYRRLKGIHGVVLSTDDYFYRNQRCIYVALNFCSDLKLLIIPSQNIGH